MARAPVPAPPSLDDEHRRALALLAHGLIGALEVSGLDALPHPDFRAATAPAPSPEKGAPKLPPSPPAPAPPPSTPPPPADTAATLALDERIARLIASPGNNASRLAVLRDDIIGACTRCKLHRGRNQLVFGAGDPTAELVFVGEGPGADEDREGIPFVGRAGQLLTQMIQAMGFRRDEVYICNVVKCRPPNNRDPEPDEVEACAGFLDAQLAIVRPKVIVGLGRYACHTLLGIRTPITKLRGHWQTYRGVDFMPTYHPSYLLREEHDPKKTRKRETWSDLQQVMRRFGREPRR